ncbi:uncharacterized protein MELLADRAFT_105351 [Melampsora larici-populina 98AG31]|uniref:Uncharacterized protein n=1 Tax=Melampsora larici-populina (strain 98AG31 / pathotype 3-4-7) TaxID=747676 RepID=F4RHU8_MELLP|nr:uncharacterized protein MELLADRAFT_105351 [Melampsora larici-populina 98AG31]EGG08071.1 hypothetical protein MELLADRAFT_105351 [Melampsora larici-populina 98AG31]
MAPRNRTNLSRPTNRLKKPRNEASQSAQELSEWDDNEEKWCAKECDLLSRALTQPEPATNNPWPNEIEGDQFIGGNDGYYDFDDDAHTPPHESSDSGAESDDSVHSLASDTDVGVAEVMNDTNTNQLKLQLEDLIEHEEDLREINETPNFAPQMS